MRKKWDWLLSAQILALGAISLLVIYSINRPLFFSQSISWIIGIVILLFVAQIDYRYFLKSSIIIYIASLIFLIFVFFFGNAVRGSIRWIDLGFFRFQPSELAKVASILMLATFYQEKQATKIKNLILSFLLISPFAFLVLIEPDIGNALSFIAIWFGVSVLCGFRLKYIFSLLGAGVILIVIFYELLAPYQKQRITSFLNPSADPLGTGYHIIQSKVTIGSGKLFGRGLGRGSQSQLNFLPEAESDFIFASIAEQLGFLGAGLTIGIFIWMLTKILNSARETERFGQVIIVGIVSFLIIQLTVNVGMNLGLLPVTGITFPLVSAGGSSLISCLFLLGLVFSINKNKIP